MSFLLLYYLVKNLEIVTELVMINKIQQRGEVLLCTKRFDDFIIVQ